MPPSACPDHAGDITQMSCSAPMAQDETAIKHYGISTRLAAWIEPGINRLAVQGATIELTAPGTLMEPSCLSHKIKICPKRRPTML